MIKATPPMSREEELEMIARAKAGDERAKSRIVSSLVRLVRRDAKKWADQDSELDDLVQVGLLWLMHAVTKFDPKKGVRLASYGRYWWNQYMRRESRLGRAQGRSGALAMMLNNYGTLKPLLDKVVIDGGDYVSRFAELAGISKERAEAFVNLHKQTLSLNVKATDSSADWLYRLVDTDSATQDGELHRKEVSAEIQLALDKLTDVERTVFYLRHQNGHYETHAAIGRALGFSRQRSQQIEVQVFRKLRLALIKFKPEENTNAKQKQKQKQKREQTRAGVVRRRRKRGDPTGVDRG